MCHKCLMIGYNIEKEAAVAVKSTLNKLKYRALLRSRVLFTATFEGPLSGL